MSFGLSSQEGDQVPQDDIFRAIFNEMVLLRLHWKMFREIFGHSEERNELLNSASPIFGPIGDCLRDNVVLSIARLFDRAQVGRKETVSLRAAVQDLSLPQADANQLLEELAVLKASCDYIIQLRHKVIAHNDKSFLSGEDSLQTPSRRDIEETIHRLGEFVRMLWARKYNGEDVGFESPDEVDLPYWIQKLFNVLRAGLDQMETDRIGRRDEFRRRYGVDTPDEFDPPQGSI